MKINIIRPGDRVIVIKSEQENEGKIGVCTSYFNPRTSTWKGKAVSEECTVIIRSLGTPFRSTNGPSMEGPMDPKKLRKLPDTNSFITQLEALRMKLNK